MTVTEPLLLSKPAIANPKKMAENRLSVNLFSQLRSWDPAKYCALLDSSLVE
jgi:hypothetical protein